jgi:TetR/AcrR family transcriptional regulator
VQKSRIRLASADRQSEIIAAVLRLAASAGPADITTSEIARQLNLTQGAVFRHFPNKEAIWLAVMGWVAETLLANLAAARDEVTSPLAALRAMFMAHVRFVVAHPGVPRLIFNELQQPGDSPVKSCVRALLADYRRLLAALLDEAGRSGQLVAGLDKAAAATLFIGSVQGLVMQSMLLGSTDNMEHAAEPVFSLYLGAIAEAA